MSDTLNWSAHMKRAEELLKRTMDPAMQVNQATKLLMQADIHIKIADLKWKHAQL